MITNEEVEAAQRAAEEAKTASENAHKAQEAAAAQAKAARDDADAAEKQAKDATRAADDKEKEAAGLERAANASATKCSNATAQKAKGANAICAQATADHDAAATSRQEATALRTDATQKTNDAAATETAALAAETNVTNTTLAALIAAGLAKLQSTQAASMLAEFQAQQPKDNQPGAPAPLRDPAVGDTCAMVGLGPAPSGNGGIQSDTKATFSTGGRHGILTILGENYEKIQGTLVEITVGNKISNLGGGEVSKIAGGKLDEVGGWESKLVIGGDRRFIAGPRWERNVGLKAESITGDVTQTELAGQIQHVPAINGSSNPSTKTETCPKVESISTKVVEQHKDKLKELRKTIKQNFKQATEHYDSVTSNISTYTDDIGKIRENVQTKLMKFASLKTEAKKYQMKSDAFIKIIVDGTVKLTAGTFKGSGKKKYHICCDAIAELQGDVKWN